MGYVSLTKLSLLIQDKLTKLNAGHLTATELDELKELTTELNERIIVLQYKAHESQLLKTANSILHQEATQIHVKQNSTISEPLKLNFGAHSNPIPKLETKIEEKKPIVEQIKMPIEVEPIVQSKPIVHEKHFNEPKPVTFNETKNAPVEKPKRESETLVADAPKTKLTLVERMQKTKVDNLATAIGLNQKFLFMNFLFEGENNSYADAIEKLNNMPTVADARHYIRELAYIYTWDYENENVILFTEYIERRYI